MPNELETKTSGVLEEVISTPIIPLTEKISTTIEEITPKDLEKVLLLENEITITTDMVGQKIKIVK